MKKLNFLCLVLLMLRDTQAQTIPNERVVHPDIDPAAKVILDQSAQAYADLNGLSMDFSGASQGYGESRKYNGTIAFARPAQAKVEYKAGGKTSLFLGKNGKFVIKERPGEYIVRAGEWAQTIGDVLYNIPSELGHVLPQLSLGKSHDISGYSYIAVKKAAVLSGNSVLLTGDLGTPKQPYTLRLTFDPTDRLLRRVDAEWVSHQEKFFNNTILTNVQANPRFSPNTFVFTPAPGDSSASRPSPYDPRLKIGTAPFPLVTLDLNGHPQPWSKYRGKVVLLHFWGIWPDPYKYEIPTILSLLKKYQKDGFRVVGVPVRTGKAELQGFLKAHKMSYPQLFDRQDFSNREALRYQITDLPFSLLIGKDGKIVAIHPQGPILEKAIQKALAAS